MKTYKVIIEEDGTQRWYNEKDQLHREDGPAIVGKNDYQEWFINGKLHREDGPAIVGKNDRQYWYKNGKLHREDGPAIVGKNGYQSWWVNGFLHREDGHAVGWYDGYKQWWINGKQLTEQEFNNRTKPCSGKIVVVDGIEYTLT